MAKPLLLIVLLHIVLVYTEDLPTTCIGDQCDPNWTPFPNMVSGLRGYNLASGDPMKDFSDPGFADQIFLPTMMTDNNMVSLDPAITASELSNCRRSMIAHSYTTTSGLRNSYESFSKTGTDLQVGLEADVTAGVEGVDVSTTIPPAFSRAWSQSESFKQSSSLFTSETGMMSTSQGVCIQYEMSLSTYMLPKFTDPFTIALGELHDASKLSSTEQGSAFKKFVQNFGTHYMTDVQLGATFSQMSSYSQNIRKEMDHQTLEDCNYVSGAKAFGIPVEPDTTSCKTEDQSELNTYASADFNHQIVSKGSDPTNIKDWATQEFTPIPLKYRFSPIANLFQKVFIDDKGYSNSAGEVVNSTAIRMWFVPLYYDYCVTMELDCTEPKGCGYDDQCPFDTLCTGTADEPHECSEWTQWACVTCGKGTEQKRTRTCNGCQGDSEQHRNHECEEQPACDKFADCTLLKGNINYVLQCPEGYVGVGLCGSQKGADCGYALNYANMLLCCKVREDPRTQNCKMYNEAGYGAKRSCDRIDNNQRKLITQYCGSRKGKDCNGYWNKYNCCQFPAVKTNPDTCTWKHGQCGENINCDYGQVLAGGCGSGKGTDCSGHSNSALCCPLQKTTAVDHCVMYRGWYGYNIRCPSGYIATGACAGGKSNDCGVGASTRLKCCKINVASTSQTCSPVATTTNGKDITCPKTDGRLTLVTEYCESGMNNDCAGSKSHSIKCCEQTNLMVNESTCQWIGGLYGEYVECPTGYAMTGSCGSGKYAACDGGNKVHKIRCCKIE